MGLGKLWFLVDPTFLFGLNAYVSVLFVFVEDKTLTLQWPNPKAVQLHMTDPAVFISIGLTILAMILVWSADVSRLKISTIRRACWYLWNGCIFHVIDGMIGLGFVPVMASNFEYLDIRFREVPFSEGGPHPSEAIIAHILVLMEIFVMTPLCLTCFVGIIHQKKWAQEAEIILCVIHCFGTIIFAVPPLFESCVGLAPIGLVGCWRSASMFELFFFWFGYLANYIWLFLPGMLLVRAVRSNLKKKEQIAPENPFDIVDKKKTS